MGGYALGIIINLISAPLIFFGGILFNKTLGQRIRRHMNTLRNLMHFRLKGEDKILVTFGYVIPEASTNYVIEQGDVTALLSAKDLIISFCPEQQLELRDSISVKDNFASQRNIFSLSGPKWNKVSEHYLGQLGSPATFCRNPKGVMVNTSRMSEPIIYKTVRKDHELAQTCYGLIVSGRLNHDTKEEQNIVICAGKTTLSTNGSLLFLRQLSRKSDAYQELRKRGILKSLNKWGLLLKVDRQFASSRGIIRPLQPNDVNIQIVNVFLEEDFVPPYEYDYSK